MNLLCEFSIEVLFKRERRHTQLVPLLYSLRRQFTTNLIQNFRLLLFIKFIQCQLAFCHRSSVNLPLVSVVEQSVVELMQIFHDYFR